MNRKERRKQAKQLGEIADVLAASFIEYDVGRDLHVKSEAAQKVLAHGIKVLAKNGGKDVVLKLTREQFHTFPVEPAGDDAAAFWLGLGYDIDTRVTYSLLATKQGCTPRQAREMVLGRMVQSQMNHGFPGHVKSTP